MKKQQLGKFVFGFTALAGAFLSSSAARAVEAPFPSIEFSAQEIADHQASLPVIMGETSRCLNRVYQEHLSSIQEFGVSNLYGEASDFYKKMDEGQKLDYLANNLHFRNGQLLSRSMVREFRDKMGPTSCVGFTFKCMKAGFKAAGPSQARLWEKLKNYTVANGTDGSALQNALQGLGWKLLYWNPNPAYNKEWDSLEKNYLPAYKHATAAGQHERRYQDVVKTGRYYRTRVDNATALVGYGHNPQPLMGEARFPDGSVVNFVKAYQFSGCYGEEGRGNFFKRNKPSYSACLPSAFRRVPLFLGTAHAGFHVFMGGYGQVVESHAMMESNSPRLVETGDFFGGGVGMSPKYNYFSGVIAVPPGYGF